MDQLQRYVGRPVSEVPTPALVLDLDAFDRNAASIAGELSGLGVAWRPHAKAHGSPVLAARQIALGAIGVTCATVAEASVMAGTGIPRILIANQIATPGKADQVAKLQAGAEVVIAVDSGIGCELLDEAALSNGTTIPVLIEVDIGMARSGAAPGPEVVALASAIAARPGLRLAGVMGYEGHTLDMTPRAAKEAAIREAIERLLGARDDLHMSGIDVGIVSCGGTGSYRTSATIPGVTEIQAGGGCFADRFYAEACGVDGLDWALTVHATVVSRPTADRAIVDAGMKAMSISDGAPLSLVDGVTVDALFAEHGKLRLEGGGRRLRVGDRVPFVPGYSDSTTMLHGAFIGVRGGVVDMVIPRSSRLPI